MSTTTTTPATLHDLLPILQSMAAELRAIQADLDASSTKERNR